MPVIAISGAIANKLSNGGEAWVRLSWARGFQQLGFHVLFLEQLPSLDGNDAGSQACCELRGKQIRYFERVMTQFGRGISAALVDAQGKSLWGLAPQDVTDLARHAVALINISGHLEVEQLKDLPRAKVYIDLDPGFTQFWQLQGNLGARLAGHDFYFSVGENIGADDCEIPTNGIAWRPVRQPVVLDDWPLVATLGGARFTTIGSWRGSFGPVIAGDRIYGQKVHEFRKYATMPRLVNSPFELALDIHPTETKDLSLLRESHWNLVDPHRVAGDPAAFRRYIQGSTAEFSVAQGMYVETNSGWFSDRTVRYLASGKPALVQDSGFSRNLPVGEGLLSFRTLPEAISGAESILRDYERHARAARSIAAEHFESDRVLRSLLAEVDIAIPPERACSAKHLAV